MGDIRSFFTEVSQEWVKSRRDRMRAKLQEIKEALRRRMHRPIPETGKWLAQIVAGYFAYHAVPTNSAAIGLVPDRPTANEQGVAPGRIRRAGP
jgi:hypothetical protein